MEFIYNDGGRREAGYKGDTGDCVTRAVTIASGRPYQEIYDRFATGNATQKITKNSRKREGKKTAAHGISTTRKWFKDYMQSIGFVWVPKMFVGQGCKVHLKADELPKGRLVVSLSGHYTTVIDGVIHDTYDPSRNETRCVYGYFELIEPVRKLKFRAWDGEDMLINLDCINLQELAMGVIQFGDEPENQKKVIVMQFVGLTDKKGTLVFEGDVVKRDYYNMNFAVVWSDKHAGFRLQWPDGGLVDFPHGRDMEVIGNVYTETKWGE